MVRACVVVTAALPAAASGQIAFDGDQPGRQLVQACGVAQPSIIFFPSSQAARSRRSPARLAIGPADATEAPTVVGGQDVRQEAGRWPWMVLLAEQVNGRRRWTCGGTLLSARTVLTAAHCVSGRQASALTARLGEHDTTTTRDGAHTDVSVSRITIHPNYRDKQNDIALLQLSRSVKFTRRIQPTCLPAADADHTGKSVDLAGWGFTEFSGKVPTVLQEVTLIVVDEQQCERAYQAVPFYASSFPGGFQGTKLCANGADGTSKDACRGDSGGPLVYRAPGGSGRYQVVGVVSTGLGCGNPAFPGVYTKVSKYISWIFSNSN